MKQAITKSQWDEIDENQKVKFCVALNQDKWNKGEEVNLFIPNIGQMIEFLGKGWYLHLFMQGVPHEKADYKEHTIIPMYEGELCDALWEAVKYKLENYAKDNKKNNN